MTPHYPLELVAEALPAQVGTFRRALRRWLADALGPDDEAADLGDDLILAASEALENVVDHAYEGVTPGSMTLTARVDGTEVTVVVTDAGHWREPDTGPTTRGRGIALMESLAEARVDRGEPGTVVTLRRGTAATAQG
ncbi:ATP-binding protein [Actinomycetospora atypica]|uniref:ATP-binding protein n=1 Tax=Actinomycetospora atypica TaxID=1290095 RepID=A0ABV9YVX1_9PSEU